MSPLMSTTLRPESGVRGASICRSKELTKRTINHPNFRNVSMIEASRQLEAMSDGECIFRPHHKTTNLICLSIKVPSLIFAKADPAS